MRSPIGTDELIVRAVSAGCAALAARLGEVNDLNVFPVADGDTGTNLLLTARAVEEAALASVEQSRLERCATVVRGTLMGARGNSGMILSQLVRGAADALATEDRPLDGAALARALRAAADAAYAAVRRPVEGTMLTVARRMAEAAEGAGGDLERVLAVALDAGRDAVRHSPEMLDVLRDSGVVDAGGLGLQILLEGIAATWTGRPVEGIEASPRPAPPDGAHPHPPSRYRYCTTFLLNGADVDLDALETALLDVGDSVLVMGDARQVKVHVHTDDPWAAAGLGRAHGRVDALRADDMRRQEAERAARLAGRELRPGARCAAIALAPGAGVRELLASLGALALPPGVEAETLHAALRDLDAEEVVVVCLGEHRDHVGALRDADARPLELVEVSSAPAALAAMVGLDSGAAAVDNRDAMAYLAEQVRHGAVWLQPDGTAVAEAEGRALAPAADLRSGLDRVLDTLAPRAALVTVLLGARLDVDASEVEAWARARVPGAEIEVHGGGQAQPALSVGAE